MKREPSRRLRIVAQVAAAEADRCRSVGGTLLRIMRASVVLPLPDSPMIVKISGRSAVEREAHVVHGIGRRRARSRPPIA